MKKILVAVVLLLSYPPGSWSQELAELAQPPNGDNQKAVVSQWIGPVQVSIAYHSPRVHFKGAERTGHIWGELIPLRLLRRRFWPDQSATVARRCERDHRDHLFTRREGGRKISESRDLRLISRAG
jgi:hypothetical protein